MHQMMSRLRQMTIRKREDRAIIGDLRVRLNRGDRSRQPESHVS